MTYSRYTDKVMLASPSNYNAVRTNKIMKITPHHTAGVLSAANFAAMFQDPARKASANYIIGGDGTVICNVPEESRAFTSSSPINDNQAITFELCNSTGAPTWEVSDKCLNKFIDVSVDICQRYGIAKLTRGENLTWHSMFSNTQCCGPYLMSKLDWIASTINARLGATAEPAGVVSKGATGCYVVWIQDRLNIYGYGLAVDGDFGALTESAVKDFQTKNGLDPDGVVGPITTAALKKEPAMKASEPTGIVSKGAYGSATLWIQQRLNVWDSSYGLDEDGDFGVLTDAAVKDFQSKNGLDADGIVGPLTKAALKADPPKPIPEPEPEPIPDPEPELESETEQPKGESTLPLYRVQAGAFLEKKNAEAAAADLAKKGIDTIIKYF